MNRKVLRLAYVIVGTFMIGCGGGSGTKPDAGDAGKVYPEASVNFDAPPDRKDATPTTDTSTDTAGTLPVVGAGSTLIVKGSIDLIGTGTDSCTNQIPPTGDRWCGFARLSADLVDSELWIVDVTKVAAGVTVQCDATVGDPNCVRLSTGLYADPSNGFRIHGFDGDTLTYSEVPSRGGSGSFVGNVFAWRPGWSAPHNLTGANGMVCNGSAAGTAAVCFANPMVDPTGTFYHTAELHAGVLSDKDGPLPLVDTIILRTAGDGSTGVQKWGARLTPDGRSVAWSTRTTDTGTEDLKWQNVGDDSSRVQVASDVDQWIVTSDSQKWLWLKTYNYGLTAAPAGTLQSAPYPSGAPPVTLATAVGDFTEAGAGVFYRSQVASDGTANLLLARDRSMMTAAAMIDSGVSFVFEATKDGKYATYTKVIGMDANNNTFFDIYVAGTTGTMPCAFTSTTSGFLPPTFIAGGTMAAWGRFNPITQEIEGVTTTVSGCLTAKFASDILEWTPIGDEGLVYLDDYAANPAVNEASLRYAKVTAGALPGSGAVVQARAGLEYAPLLPAMDAVVYTMSTNTAVDGLYINTKLPFTATGIPPVTDAGTDATATSDAGTTDAGDAQPGG